jgi:hypothetical protein
VDFDDEAVYCRFAHRSDSYNTELCMLGGMEATTKNGVSSANIAEINPPQLVLRKVCAGPNNYNLKQLLSTVSKE